MFLDRTVEACSLVFAFGGDFLIENPLLSLLWQTPQLLQLVRSARAFNLECDQCVFGTLWMKPTRFACSNEQLDVLCVRCPGGYTHESLKGKVWDPALQRMVFKTKQAQVYPLALCATIADQVRSIFLQELPHLKLTFELCVPAADRKRALHSARPWKEHKQADTAQKALLAGYQLKRGAAKPLLEVEMEPGAAVLFALQQVHPFSRWAVLPPALDAAIHAVVTNPSEVLRHRAQALQFWQHRAEALLPESIARIMAQPDAAQRRLLLGTDDPARARLGDVCHIALYEEMLAAANSVDQTLPKFLLVGFPHRRSHFAIWALAAL